MRLCDSMPDMTKKTFQAVADILCQEKANPSMINAFANMMHDSVLQSTSANEDAASVG